MPLAFKPILRGIVYAVVAALILSGLIGILTNLTSLPSSEIVNNGIFSVSVFVGAVTAARMAGTKGLYYGICVGVGVVVLILIISAIMLPNPFSWQG
ncbi:MAG: TIGR04086 family membrane protein, partial [Peptococcaceae bacterium]|nr:TIGR04086 family membrane protein [Peptococcaceae bacterium]